MTERLRFHSRILSFALLFLAACAWVPPALAAGNAQRWKLGFGVDGAYGVHPADFNPFETFFGIAAETGVRQETGDGFSLGASHTVLYRPWEPFWLGLRLDVSHSVESLQGGGLALTLDSGQQARRNVEYRLSGSRTLFGIEPLLEFSLARAWSVQAGLGMRFVSGHSYTWQRRTTRAGEIFADSRRAADTIAQGDFPAVRNPAISARLALSHSFFPQNELELRSAVYCRADVTPVLKNTDWRAVSVGLDLSLLYVPELRTPVERDTIFRRDTLLRIVDGPATEVLYLQSADTSLSVAVFASFILQTLEIDQEYIREVPRENAFLSGNLQIGFVSDDGQLSKRLSVRIRRQSRTRFFPLLPYVFFDENSARLPERYRGAAPDSARPYRPGQSTAAHPLARYYDILNIIGRRMQARPEAELHIVGCNGNRDGERDNLSLSGARAETIRNYLNRHWGIAPERCSISVRNLPEFSSPANRDWGYAENRRVELYSDDPRLLAPVRVVESRFTADPPKVRFTPQALSEAGLQEWRIAVNVGGNIVKTFAGEGRPPVFLDWPLNSERIFAELADTRLSSELVLRDVQGQEFRTPPGFIDLEYSRLESVAGNLPAVEKHSLISFHYDLAELKDRDDPGLQDLRERLRSASDVHIQGFADATGTEERNTSLSFERARTVSTALDVEGGGLSGVGETVQSYPNDVPEGRMYNRRVDIIIQR